MVVHRYTRCLLKKHIDLPPLTITCRFRTRGVHPKKVKGGGVDRTVTRGVLALLLWGEASTPETGIFSLKPRTLGVQYERSLYLRLHVGFVMRTDNEVKGTTPDANLVGRPNNSGGRQKHSSPVSYERQY